MSLKEIARLSHLNVMADTRINEETEGARCTHTPPSPARRLRWSWETPCGSGGESPMKQLSQALPDLETSQFPAPSLGLADLAWGGDFLGESPEWLEDGG